MSEKFRVKEIGWAYPTSPIANKLKFKGGCWYVKIGACYPNTRTIRLGGLSALLGFETFEAAHAYAETLVQPYASRTWTPEKYAEHLAHWTPRTPQPV